MDREAKSLVSSKSKKNQFLTDLKLKNEKDNPSPGKNNLSNWQYSILSTSREIEPYLILTFFSLKIGWWRQTGIAAQATSTGVVNYRHCLFYRRSLRRAVSLTVCASKAATTTDNRHQQPSPSSRQSSLRTISSFRNCFQSIAPPQKINPLVIKYLLLYWPCWRFKEKGEPLCHHQNQLISNPSLIISRILLVVKDPRDPPTQARLFLLSGLVQLNILQFSYSNYGLPQFKKIIAGIHKWLISEDLFSSKAHSTLVLTNKLGSKSN